INQIILATDGDFDLDKSDKALYRLIAEYREKGIYLSVIGFGSNPAAIAKMQRLAEAGGGMYIHVNTEQEAQTALSDQIRKQSKRQ
ncbi:MAG: hypothetical protein M3Q97_05795, partial [Bacteroidota bacterium]|nr:hypothetical protein [Bacteroidota bacterium]